MLGTAGVLFTAALGLPQWFEAGEKALEGAISTLDSHVRVVFGNLLLLAVAGIAGCQTNHVH